MTATPPPTDNAADAVLLRRWAEDRDEDAIRTLVQRYAPLVHSTCRRYLGDSADADEAAQATFIALSAQAGAIRDPSLLPGWLHRTALRACARVRRSAQRRRRIEQAAARRAASAPADAEVDWSQARPFLDQALDTIPAGDRAALIAYIVDGVPQGDLAQREGVSREAVKKRIQRAVARLEGWYRQRGITTAAAALMAGATRDLAASAGGVQGCLHAVAQPGDAPRQARSIAAELQRGPAIGNGLATGAATLLVVGLGVLLVTQVAPALQLSGKGEPAALIEIFVQAFAPLAILIPLVAIEEAVAWWRTRESHWAPLALLALSTITTCIVMFLVLNLRPGGVATLDCFSVGGITVTVRGLIVPVALLGASVAGAAWVLERVRNRKRIPRAATAIRCLLLAALLGQLWFGCLRWLLA